MKKSSPFLMGVLPLMITSALGLSSTQAVAEEEKAERITVTGSHIKQSDVEGASPVLVIDRDAIDASGATSLKDLLQDLPSSGDGSFNVASNSQDGTSIGSAGFSFRGLGADKTLVLVNGRRVTVSPFAEEISTAFVDLNTIPLSAIKRVEILKDGASATYGSDAMAGVVNIILRNDFDGAQFNANLGNTTEDDATEQSFSFLWGSSSDKTKTTVILDYYKRNALYLRDRSYSASADQRGNPEGDDWRSSAPELINYQDPTTGEFYTHSACPADRITDLGAGGEICRFDYAPFITAIPGTERFGAVTMLEHDINNDMTLFGEFMYQHNSGMVSGAPSPAFNLFTMSADNPNNPFDEDLTRFRRRFVEAGPRVYEYDTDNSRVLLGLTGTFGTWDWEAAYQNARSQTVQYSTGGFVRTDLVQAAIDDGSFNPFEFGTAANAAAVEGFTTDVTRRGVSRAQTYDAKITGELAELPAGSLSAAFGIEHRKESIVDSPDKQFADGLIVGTESTAAEADRDHTSFYAEFNAPVVEDFEIQFALRHEDYSDFGTTTNPKLAMHYKASDMMTFRASWGTGFRAPSLAQLGLGRTNESPELIDNIRCPLTGQEPDCTPTEYIAYFEGNPDLDAEESESVNLGGVFQFTDDLSLVADYWSYELDNLIEKNTQALVNANSENVIREPSVGGVPGRIMYINDSFYNVAETKTDGIDLDLRYKMGLNDLGRLNMQLSWTHVMSYEEKSGPDASFVDENGAYRRPEDRMNFTADWSNDGDWAGTFALNYIGSYKENADLGKTGTVGSWLTANAQVRYAGLADGIVSFGIDNIFDEEPPYTASEFQGYDYKTHSPRGRYVYVSYSYNF